MATDTKLAELHDRVHPKPKPPEPDLPKMIKEILARQRFEEEEKARRAERARFEGGPCVQCGVTTASRYDDNGIAQAGWHEHPRGSECAVCSDWRDDRGDEVLLDMVATMLREDGTVAGIERRALWWCVDRGRCTLRIEPGLATRLGVVAWIDSNRPATGVRWSHLDAAESLLRRETTSEVNGPTLDEFIVAQAVATSRSIDVGPPYFPARHHDSFVPSELPTVQQRRERAKARVDRRRDRR